MCDTDRSASHTSSNPTPWQDHRMVIYLITTPHKLLHATFNKAFIILVSSFFFFHVTCELDKEKTSYCTKQRKSSVSSHKPPVRKWRFSLNSFVYINIYASSSALNLAAAFVTRIASCCALSIICLRTRELTE